MNRLLLAGLLLTFVPFVAAGQGQTNGVDPQVRVLNHIQRFEEKNQIGWAVWAIAPNVVKTNPFRGLIVGGVALRDKDKTKWIEFMAGAFVATKGKVDPVIDIRTAQNFKRIGFTEEMLYAFRSKRLILPTTVTTPLPVQKQLKLRIGSDSDVVKDPNGWHVGLGPRISLLVPGTKNKVTLATAFQKGLFHQRNIWRTYVVVNW